MATIIRAADAPTGFQAVPLNFDDIAAQAEQHVAGARIDAAHIVAEAQNQADSIRREAAEAGCKAAMQDVEKRTAEQLAPLLAALRDAAAEVHQARQAWLSRWEAAAVRLATAMAARVIRRELQMQPEITIDLVRESLELAAGSPNVRLHLNPEDYRVLGKQVRAVTASMSALGSAEVVSDAAIGRGGCLVETRFGTIDQQIESQLQRIEEELLS